jgi:hypothetical protein
VFALFLLLPATQASAQNEEYSVKAAYITKFVPFIDWPESVSRKRSVTICILGENRFGSALERAATSPASDGRTISIRRFPTIDSAELTSLSECQMAYVGDALTGIDIMDYLNSRPIVTITDSDIRSKGVIRFVLQENHIRFDIDDALAERNGIHISSKLLELARSTTSKTGGR